MTTSKFIAIAMAALLVFAGSAVAASHGQTPTDADANASATADEHRPDDAGDGDDDASDENASEAPPTELPENVPDHVNEIHALIAQKLNGTLNGSELGERIGSLVGNGDDAERSASNPPIAPDEANRTAQSGDAGEESRAVAADERDQPEAAGESTSQAGPTGDVPEQAADHVTAIQDALASFLSGDGDGTLGETISGIVGDGQRG